nr:PK-interacting protein [Calliteara abietis nucleopolyhedrovirus]
MSTVETTLQATTTTPLPLPISISETIMILRKKRDKYYDEYTAKAHAFFVNSHERQSAKSLQNSTEELFIMSATLFGYNEEIIALENGSIETGEAIDFINNLSEFQLDNDVIETLIRTKDHVYFLSAVKADRCCFDDDNVRIVASLNRNGKKFTGLLDQFVQKRNRYRSTAADSLLRELVLLKGLLIRHFCVVEKLAQYKTGRSSSASPSMPSAS